MHFDLVCVPNFTFFNRVFQCELRDVCVPSVWNEGFPVWSACFLSFHGDQWQTKDKAITWAHPAPRGFYFERFAASNEYRMWCLCFSGGASGVIPTWRARNGSLRPARSVFIPAVTGKYCRIYSPVLHVCRTFLSADRIDQSGVLIDFEQGRCGVERDRNSCVLWFCSEENVWKLCEFVRQERTAPLEELLVVFISNENRTVRTQSC